MNLLTVTDLSVRFEIGQRLFGRSRGTVDAVDGVAFELRQGETLALVGESGSGKSTLARAILALQPVHSGSVIYRRADGEQSDLLEINGAQMRALRPELQMVFQDPGASLNPRFRVRELLAEAPRQHFGLDPTTCEREVAKVLERVGLSADSADRFPHEFSAGQRQRIAIARALILKPRLLVCDEIVSSLDVSVQAGILNLLLDLQSERNLTYLFIAHDLAVVRALAHRVAVMRSGQLLELSPANKLFKNPAHPYTRSLLAAIE